MPFFSLAKRCLSGRPAITNKTYRKTAEKTPLLLILSFGSFPLLFSKIPDKKRKAAERKIAVRRFSHTFLLFLSFSIFNLWHKAVYRDWRCPASANKNVRFPILFCWQKTLCRIPIKFSQSMTDPLPMRAAPLPEAEDHEAVFCSGWKFFRRAFLCRRNCQPAFFPPRGQEQ